MQELLLKNEVFAVIGAAIEVHRELGPGFLEAVYHEAMEMELIQRRVPFLSHHKLTLHYKGKPLTKKYECDFLCYESLVVEIKAETCLTPIDEAQLLNYLRVTHLQVGLLANFGSHGKLEWRRMVNSASS